MSFSRCCSVILLWFILLSPQTFACLSLLAEGPPDPNLDPILKWTDGWGPTRGHEDITRWAITLANEELKKDYPLNPLVFYPEVKSGNDHGPNSSHHIIVGNYQTDFATQKLRNFYGITAEESWLFSPKLMYQHSLRNMYKSADNSISYPTAYRSCLSIRKHISQVAAKAQWYLRKKQTAEGLFWIGHALHTIQDSFGPAHTQRKGPDLRQLQDICLFNVNIPGICYHQYMDWRDRPWKYDLSCQINPWNRDLSCFTDEALKSTWASAGFLLVFKKVREEGRDLTKELRKYFLQTQGKYDKYGGYFQCRQLIRKK